VIIDTSAVMAILQLEPEEPAFLRAIDADPHRLMSAVNWVEASMVMGGRRGARGTKELDEFIARARIDVTPVQLLHAQLAREAFLRFGRGRHPARLNCGDCFAYALAKATGEPLLFKGDDFGLTDIRTVA
jgi:ribonuclease VapC